MTRIQTIVDQQLKVEAEEKFKDIGLNLSEGVRFIITNFVNGNINVNFDSKSENIKLSKESKVKYKNILTDIEENKNLLDLEDLD